MFSVDDLLDELVAKLKEPGSLNPARSDPIFYVAYPPEHMQDVQAAFPRWKTRLESAGYRMHRVSLPEILWKLVDESGRWETWLELEEGAEPEVLNASIADVLTQDNAFAREVEAAVSAAPQGSVVFLTEAELLHPYLRSRGIESWLHDRADLPVVIFYPGTRSGQYGLQFLGFYPVDPNYRSTVLGGY